MMGIGGDTVRFFDGHAPSDKCVWPVHNPDCSRYAEAPRPSSSIGAPIAQSLSTRGDLPPAKPSGHTHIPAADAGGGTYSTEPRRTLHGPEVKATGDAVPVWLIDARRRYVLTLIGILSLGDGSTTDTERDLMDRIERMLEAMNLNREPVEPSEPLPASAVRDDLTECWHDFGEPGVVVAGTGDRVLVSDCRKCNTGAISLERSPGMTVQWLMEHLEGVVPA